MLLFVSTFHWRIIYMHVVWPRSCLVREFTESFKSTVAFLSNSKGFPCKYWHRSATTSQVRHYYVHCQPVTLTCSSPYLTQPRQLPSLPHHLYSIFTLLSPLHFYLLYLWPLPEHFHTLASLPTPSLTLLLFHTTFSRLPDILPHEHLAERTFGRWTFGRRIFEWRTFHRMDIQAKMYRCE